MFNRGKTNQGKDKEIDRNGTSGCFPDLVGNRFHVCVEKREKRKGNRNQIFS